VVNVDQLTVRADAGGGNVILNSAYALLQGLYPSTKKSELTLANGTTILPPLGGYQYVPGKSLTAILLSSNQCAAVESLEYWQSPSLTSWMDCEV
jgi:prostatic aicd phosphatase